MKNMKRIKTGALALALSIGSILPGAMALGTNIVHADDTTTTLKQADFFSSSGGTKLSPKVRPANLHQTKVVLHKYYSDDKEKTITNEEINNPRGKADPEVPEWLKPYDTAAQEKYGELGFTIYKLTDDDGNSPAISDFNAEGTLSINEERTKATVNGEEYNLTAVKEEQKLDADGKITFEDQENGSYVIVETKRPTTYVLNRSQDLFFSLPFANDNGTGFVDEIHVSPKNKVEQRNFIFTKM